MRPEEYEIARNVLKLANRIITNRNRHTRVLGITTEQADSLYFFHDNAGSSIKDLQLHLGLKHQTAQGIVQRMIEKGLLESTVSPQDARRKEITLTDAGRTILSHLAENRSNTGEKLLSGMTDEEGELFNSLILRAYESIREGDGNYVRTEE